MAGGGGVADGVQPVIPDAGRSSWLLLAASLAIGWGLFSVAFAAVTWSVDWSALPTSVLILSWPLASVVAGVGLLGHRPWARVLAAVLAALTLVSDLSGLLLVPTSGAWSPFGLIEIGGAVLMLYALIWHWPPAGRA